MMREEEGLAPVDGCRLRYQVRGEGPALVLIHAGLWDLRIWDDQMEPFARAHTVVRFDLPGFGRSEFPDQPFSLRRQIADLLGFLGIPRASVVGGSIGGQIALDFALEHPEMVERLVLVASGMSGDDTPDDPEMIKVLDRAEEAFKAGDLERMVELQLQVWTPLRTIHRWTGASGTSPWTTGAWILWTGRSPSGSIHPQRDVWGKCALRRW